MKKNKVGKEARKPLNTWQNMRMFTMSLLIMQPKMENSSFFCLPNWSWSNKCCYIHIVEKHADIENMSDTIFLTW